MALPPILVPDDDALALLLRGQSKPVPMGVALLDKYLGLRNGDVLEVHGLAGAGKSQWCMAAVAHAILPPTVANVPIGGRGVRAVYFETDGKFPLWRFLHILESRLKAAAQAHLRPRDGPGELYALLGGKEAYEAVVRRCLEHLTVHRCHSGAQLAFALQEEAARLAAEGATDREAAATPLTGLLVLDPLGPGAFYWTDRSTDGDAPPPWVAALERIRSAYAAVVILATGPAAHARWWAGPARRLADLPEHEDPPPRDIAPPSAPLYRNVGVPEGLIKHRLLLAAHDGAFACRLSVPNHHRLSCGWVAYDVTDGGITF